MEINSSKKVTFKMTSDIYREKAIQLVDKLINQTTDEFYQWFRNYSNYRPKDSIEHRILFFSCIGEKKFYTLELYILEQVEVMQKSKTLFDKNKVINDIRNNIIANLNKIYINN